MFDCLGFEGTNSVVDFSSFFFEDFFFFFHDEMNLIHILFEVSEKNSVAKIVLDIELRQLKFKK